MAYTSDSTVIDARSSGQQHKRALRFVVCGSAGSGKRTLTGRLPYQSKMLFEGQLAILDAVGKKEIQGADSALLADELAADHEQIDEA